MQLTALILAQVAQQLMVQEVAVAVKGLLPELAEVAMVLFT